MPSTGRSAAATPRTRPMRFRPVCIDISASSLSVTVDFDNRVRKRLRRFLRQVVPDAALDHPMLVLAGELLGVDGGLRVWCAIGVALERDCRHIDVRRLGELGLELVILRLTFSQPEPPAVVVDDDVDVVGIVEGCGAAIVDCVVEVPTGRGELPDELVELVSVFLVPKPSAFGREVVLVPPLILRPREQRIPAGRLAADEVSAHRHQALAALRPERRDDVSGPRSPVEASDYRLRNLQGVHESDDRKSTRLNSSHLVISYAVFCLKKKNTTSDSASGDG